MKRVGHFGAAGVTAGIVSIPVVSLGLYVEALVLALGIVLGDLLPDLDRKIWFVTHRGITHTIWFALAVGAALTVSGVTFAAILWANLGLAGVGVARSTAMQAGIWFGLGGVIGVGSHLIADSITTWGVRPLEPVDDRKMGIELTTASSQTANYLFLIAAAVVYPVAWVVGLSMSL